MAATRRTRQDGLAALLGVGAVLLLLAGGMLRLLGGSGGQADPPIGGAWTLTRADGRTVSDRDYRGRFLLIYFGYTLCPDVCSTALGTLSEAMQQLGAKRHRLQPIFISIDPARDTPAVMRRYVDGFGSGLVGLTGTTAQLRVVQQEYRVRSVVHPADRHGAYALDHSSVLLLVGPDGRFLAPLPADEPPAAIVARLEPYLS